MATTAAHRRSRRIIWAGLLVGLPVLFYLLPLFHMVPLDAAREESAAMAFDAAAFVETFWNDHLPEATAAAVDAGELLAAFRADAAGAAERYGHRLGLSGKSSYFVSGSGWIVAVDGGTVSIALQPDGVAEVAIKTGPLFGNAIRDGSGLLDVSDFPNSRDFNAVSAEINRRVEAQVFPALNNQAAVGAAVRFVGGVDMDDAAADPSPLRLVPVAIEFP